jgi:hypothetical protein
MSKSFWERFSTGFTTASKYGIPIAVAFVLGLTLGSWSHPYEQCKRKYPNIDEHIHECVWLLENQPALR